MPLNKKKSTKSYPAKPGGDGLSPARLLVSISGHLVGWFNYGPTTARVQLQVPFKLCVSLSLFGHFQLSVSQPLRLYRRKVCEITLAWTNGNHRWQRQGAKSRLCLWRRFRTRKSPWRKGGGGYACTHIRKQATKGVTVPGTRTIVGVDEIETKRVELFIYNPSMRTERLPDKLFNAQMYWISIQKKERCLN